MRSRSLGFVRGVRGFQIGAGAAGGQPLPLLIVTIIVLAMAVTTVIDALVGGGSGINLDKQIPFKCTACTEVVRYTIRDLQKMQQPGQMGPMMGPMVLDCPKCKKKTLTQAVECPKCQEVFVMQMDPGRNLFNDKCPKCGESYAKAWQEKYRKEQGE